MNTKYRVGLGILLVLFVGAFALFRLTNDSGDNNSNQNQDSVVVEDLDEKVALVEYAPLEGISELESPKDRYDLYVLEASTAVFNGEFDVALDYHKLAFSEEKVDLEVREFEIFNFYLAALNSGYEDIASAVLDILGQEKVDALNEQIRSLEVFN